MTIPTNCLKIQTSSSGQYQNIITNGVTSALYVSNNYGKTWSLATGANNNNTNWTDLDISSDGKHQVACFASNSGLIYLSTDYGNTWSATNAPGGWWSSICISSNGKYLLANSSSGAISGFIYVSSDYGATWATANGTPIYTQLWNAIAISSDGNCQTAAITTIGIYRSIDFGDSWYFVNGPTYCDRLSISSIGLYQTATPYTNGIYRSSDSGTTWTHVTNFPANKTVTKLIISSDGKYQTVTTELSIIYVSSNFGVDWTPVNTVPSITWLSLTMSESGKYQTACGGNNIYVSDNFGETWGVLPGYPAGNWMCVGMSSNGQYQTAAGTTVYTWTNVICLLETCNLMLADGSYKNVKSIKAGDILRSALNGKDLRVLHCGYNVVHDLSRVPASNHPMHIPTGFFGEGSPSQDVFISGHHRLFFTLNETIVGIQVFKLLPSNNTLSMDKALEAINSDILRYFHVEVEGGKNAVFCDGLPAETLNAGEWDNHDN